MLRVAYVCVCGALWRIGSKEGRSVRLFLSPRGHQVNELESFWVFTGPRPGLGRLFMGKGYSFQFCGPLAICYSQGHPKIV